MSNNVASTCAIRRRKLIGALSALALIGTTGMARSEEAVRAAAGPNRRWFDAAMNMRRLAQSWGDQPYGAVLVLDGEIVGEGPSRVVKLRDSTAHAEREAIRDAQRRLQRPNLEGSVLYSTSRPCSMCEAFAAAAGVSRMYFGEDLHDAGVPTQ